MDFVAALLVDRLLQFLLGKGNLRLPKWTVTANSHQSSCCPSWPDCERALQEHGTWLVANSARCERMGVKLNTVHTPVFPFPPCLLSMLCLNTFSFIFFLLTSLTTPSALKAKKTTVLCWEWECVWVRLKHTAVMGRSEEVFLFFCFVWICFHHFVKRQIWERLINDQKKLLWCLFPWPFLMKTALD